MVNDDFCPDENGRLIPGLIHELADAGPMPQGPSRATSRRGAPVPGDERGETDHSGLGFGPGAEPVPGFHLISRIGKGGTGEVWKALGPGGFPWR